MNQFQLRVEDMTGTCTVVAELMNTNLILILSTERNTEGDYGYNSRPFLEILYHG